jgi:aminoglycoside phosphotransferase (APT) family kinase protein
LGSPAAKHACAPQDNRGEFLNSMEDFGMIPQEKTAAVTRGLREAFGVTEFAEIRRMTKGHTSSLVFRIVVGGTAFLLKIILRTDDATRHYTCMSAAAEAGLAPHVWYTSIEDRVSITDFVEEAPFPMTEGLVRIPAALAKLHALPPFAAAPNHMNTTCMFLMHKGPAVDAFIERFRAAENLPKDEKEDLLARYAHLAAVYPHHDPQMASSHNDLFKPDNLLFDGHRMWLVDWEAAFLNDRYADLAVAANLVVSNDAEEKIFLQEYFGQLPDPYQLARFHYMQLVAHTFYAIVYLLFGSSGGPIDGKQSIPEFSDFQRRMWAGEVNVADQPTKTVYGRVHWQQLLEKMEQPRYQEALRRLAGNPLSTSS